MRVNIEQGPKSRIEMLPLIDIVFLLLVFFIYAMLSMAVHHSLPVLLPTSETAKIDKRLALSITVKADGSIYVDKTYVPLANLVTVLSAEKKDEHSPGVLLFADRSLPYQSLFEVLDQIKKAGISRISLQAERDGKGR